MQVTMENGVALLRMNAGKGNAIGPAFVRALSENVRAIRDSDATAAVIVGHERIFCAGLALPELVVFERSAMREMIASFENAMESVYSLPMPCVAAINGHAIAGGCVLAMQCDVRFMSREGRIGLTEAALAIGLPPTALEPLRAAVPASSLVPVALEGKLFDAQQALALGLVDQVLAPDALVACALARARELGASGRVAYEQIKSAIRAPVVASMRASREREIERWLDTWFSPLGRTRLEAAVERLTSKA
jgi:enoyl-CoA hydratase/carnithine racemase